MIVGGGPRDLSTEQVAAGLTSSELGLGPPPLVGWVVAAAAPFVLLGVDAVDKRECRS